MSAKVHLLKNPSRQSCGEREGLQVCLMNVFCNLMYFPPLPCYSWYALRAPFSWSSPSLAALTLAAAAAKWPAVQRSQSLYFCGPKGFVLGHLSSTWKPADISSPLHLVSQKHITWVPKEFVVKAGKTGLKWLFTVWVLKQRLWLAWWHEISAKNPNSNIYL